MEKREFGIQNCLHKRNLEKHSLRKIMSKKEIIDSFNQSIELIQQSISLEKEIGKTIKLIIKSLKSGHKIVIFGNGGSAADSQHIAAELIGRFKIERNSFPAIALTTDSSIITSLSNDYSFDMVFSRQCESIVKKGDIILGISTSGNSVNVKNGLITSKNKGAITIGLLGNKGGNIKKVSDISIIINSSSTAKIQEVHRIIYHIICEFVEKELSKI
jgi:D-sedoheptulose 7-phosphate isomerase